MRSARPGTESDPSPRDRLVWLVVGLSAAAGVAWMVYQATLSRFNAVLLTLLGAVVALFVGSIAAIGWGRRTSRRAAQEPRMLAPAIIALAVGWFGFAVALFVAFSFLEAEEALRRFLRP